MSLCRVCDGELKTVISFGQMPVANAFLTPSEFASEYFFDLKVGFCPICCMVQLQKCVAPEKLFHNKYAYLSSLSLRMNQHFRAFAEDMKARYLTSHNPFVVEIGCNDGVMLQHLASDRIRHLGVEPSRNVAALAKDKGLNAVCRFFDETLAKDILKKYGSADLIVGANVICHIPDLHAVARAVDMLLKPSGLFVFEDPYLGEIVKKTAYDQIYDEHVYYLSIASVDSMFRRYGMAVVDVEPQSVHGGSMRYTIARRQTVELSPKVDEKKRLEESIGLHKYETFVRFRMRIEKSREQLQELIRDAKLRGKRIVGYGATSKSATVTNYCSLGPDSIDFVCDTTPAKQGKYSPGMHIPIKPNEDFVKDYPDFALLFAWNHKEEILGKEQEFLKRGGQFITYVPSVSILSR